MAPQGLICPKMEKYGDISVKKCDFIEVYPRFLVHSTKNLYKEKTGTRVEIWEKSVCKYTAKETIRPGTWKVPLSHRMNLNG